MRFWLGLQALVLRLAPRAFRERFGVEMLAVAGLALQDAARTRGRLGVFLVGSTQWIDVGASVVRMRLEAQPARTRVLLLAALLAASGTGWIDTHADEVQPAAFLLCAFTAVLCFLDARRALLWWLLLGASIPAAHGIAGVLEASLPYTVGHFAETFVAYLPAGAGAGLGLTLHALRRRATT